MKQAIPITIKDGLVFFLVGLFLAFASLVSTIIAYLGYLILGFACALATLTVGYFYIREYLKLKMNRKVIRNVW